MSSSSGQLVHLGSSYFGTDVKYVSVVPAEQEGSGAFLVFVSEATPESRDQSVGVVRSAREFSELHAALRGRILCAALPDLPTRPVALLEGSDGGEALEFAYSRALQACHAAAAWPAAWPTALHVRCPPLRSRHAARSPPTGRRTWRSSWRTRTSLAPKS